MRKFNSYVATRQLGRIFARNALLSTVTPKNRQEEGFMTDIDLENVDQGVEVPDEQAPDSEPDDNSPLARDVVSKIVERERKKAYEKGQKDALMQSQQDQAPQIPQQQAPAMQPQGQQSLGGMQQMSPADIERMIAEKAPQLLQEHVQNLKNEHTINSFVAKMQAAEQKYPGLEAKLNDLSYDDNMAKVISMANDMENTGDIMNELISNPHKLITVLGAVGSKQDKIAHRQIMDLSNSIKTNQDAIAQEKQAQDPMSQLKPSSSAGMDNGAMSVSDFRKMFR